MKIPNFGPPEEWAPINGFMRYEISNYGRINNLERNIEIKATLNQYGDWRVGLYADFVIFDDDNPSARIRRAQRTRLVKTLVADAFVPGKDTRFNTPILVDGNKDHIWAHNMMWRERWYAHSYTHQFSKQVMKQFRMGPIVEIDSRGIIVKVYDDIIEAGITNGLLFELIWRNIHEKKPVHPTNQIFAWADKV